MRRAAADVDYHDLRGAAPPANFFPVPLDVLLLGPGVVLVVCSLQNVEVAGTSRCYRLFPAAAPCIPESSSISKFSDDGSSDSLCMTFDSRRLHRSQITSAR